MEEVSNRDRLRKFINTKITNSVIGVPRSIILIRRERTKKFKSTNNHKKLKGVFIEF